MTHVRLMAACIGVALTIGCGSDDTGAPATPRRWDVETAKTGLVVGRLLDQDTGEAIVGAVVAISDGAGAATVTTGPDGRFEAKVAAGRAKITAATASHVKVVREVT